MSSAGELTINEDHIVLSGDWTLPYYAYLRSRISGLDAGTSSFLSGADLNDIGELDTAGASLLVDLFGAQRLGHLVASNVEISKERRELIYIVLQSMDTGGQPDDVSAKDLKFFVATMGRRIAHAGSQLKLLIGFAGQLIATCLAIVWQPQRWRGTSFIAHLHQTGLNALPIVSLLSFLVGAVVAFLGATVLDDFGATIYTVNLVAFSFLREFGVMLAAILVAGRTASAYTAQIGSMKANEEVDAIRTLGLSPMELLVVPRVLAMVVSLPILTLAGMISGIVGGSLVCILSLDIALPQILHILQERIGVIHFYVGISKAPVFAFVIAMIGCLEGFKTRGSAQSVGEHTTSAVVQSIFMVILLDSIAAIFFMEMGW